MAASAASPKATAHTTPKNPVFVALDTPDLAQAEALATALKDTVGGIKLGLEFYSAQGPEGIRRLNTLGLPVFLDLKLHDIPNTVEKSCMAIAVLSPYMLTIHAGGGEAMVQAARRGLDTGAKTHGTTAPLLLGVTVLTSLDEQALAATGVADTPLSQCTRLAKLAQAAGADGVVASSHEVAQLRQDLGSEFTLVTPGIRPEGNSSDDQARIMTPQDAITNGASYLVIGRPITQADNPVIAAKNIVDSLG